ncbi:MAG TPA: DUF2207 domain-containing protein [Erysipelotrichaceae bacterium]|nr:DUF2207 domain-containing protein [Erysipelotrichaceae bacterium]
MKKILKILAVIIICLFIISVRKTDAREAFDINFHNVDIVVNEDGSLLVTETMSVHFTSKRHGIYINLTDEYYMDWEINGQTVKKYYRFPVTNVKVLSNHKYSTNYYNGDVKIKIGDPDRYAADYETYKWQYIIHTTDLDLDGQDMLFMNIITTGWNTDTYSCEFTIHFPKTFANKDIYVSSPEGMMNDIGVKGLLTVERKDNTIIGKYNGKIAFNEGITIQVLLGQDYFQFPNPNKYGFIASIFAIIFSVFYFIVFYIYGKDDPIMPLVEYHAPKDVTSAEVGVIIDEEVNDSDIISLILDWGRRGIITILETDDDLILTKVNELESDAKNYEKILFKGLFKHSIKGKVAVSTLQDSFYKTVNNAKDALNKYYDKERTRLSTSTSIAAQTTCAIFSFVPFLFAFVLVEWKVSHRFSLLGLGVAGSIAIAAGSFLLNHIHKKRFVLKWWRYLLLGISAFSLYMFSVFSLAIVYKEAKMNTYHLVTICIFQVLIIFLTMYMRKKTEYGNEMLSRILGLREFIINAEKEKLEDLVEKNPYYFYDILPFAYALGLTNIWNEHFRNLTFVECDWYDSPYDYYDNYHMMHSMNSHFHTMQRTMTSAPYDSSSGGGSSSGGDFSSGGGFGGSSGGSW